ncbi:MAG: arsenic resistance protein [Spirochaetales bacterium]|nr:arsenic resistance protein [Spirochaetales bacterium]
MIRILLFLQKHLRVTIPVFMIAGFITGLVVDNPSALKNLILPFTFLMVYPMMVTLPLRKVIEGGDLKVQITAQIINFGVIPFVAFGLGKIFFPDKPLFALGFLLVSLLPTSGMTISWTGMSKGNMSAAVKMTVIGLLLGSVATPFYIKWLLGASVSMPMMKIFIQIGIIVLLPLVLGAITQSLLIRKYGKQKYQTSIKKKFPPFSTLGVVLIVFVAMALKARSIASDPAAFLSLIPPLLLLYAINIIISTVIGKKFFSRGDGLALVYGTVLRNLSIALAIAMTSFGRDGSSIALIIALGYIIQIQLSAWYLKLSPKIFGPAEEEPVH